MPSSSIDALAARLGIALRDPDAIRLAFVHSSYFNENATLVAGHNERLEFLGDAVIGLVVSSIVFERFPDEDEGFLTARRAALVNRESLASMALDLGLQEMLLLGRGEAGAGGATRSSLLAATFEALAGAVYASEGLDVARDWLATAFRQRLGMSDGDAPPKSAKSRLQEWAQRNHRVRPRYELLEVSGPAHRQSFRVTAMLDGEPLAEGEGSSRQRAEEQAAEAALAALRPAGGRSRARRGTRTGA
jgi:ribonuclease-3